MIAYALVLTAVGLLQLVDHPALPQQRAGRGVETPRGGAVGQAALILPAIFAASIPVAFLKSARGDPDVALALRLAPAGLAARPVTSRLGEHVERAERAPERCHDVDAGGLLAGLGVQLAREGEPRPPRPWAGLLERPLCEPGTITPGSSLWNRRATGSSTAGRCRR